MSYVEQLNNRKQTEYTIRNQDVEISQKTALVVTAFIQKKKL